MFGFQGLKILGFGIRVEGKWLRVLVFWGLAINKAFRILLNRLTYVYSAHMRLMNIHPYFIATEYGDMRCSGVGVLLQVKI